MSPVSESSLGILSESVSFERTESVRVLSSVPVAGWISFMATGVSFTHVTVMVPVAVLLAAGQKVSCARYVKVSVPQ